MFESHKIIAVLRAASGMAKAREASPQLLAALLEDRLSGEERQKLMEHLSAPGHDWLALAVAGQELGTIAAQEREEAARRATALWPSLPLAYLRLGIAPQGLKVLNHRAVEPAPGRAQVRLARLLAAAGAWPQVYPLESAKIVAQLAGRQLAVRVDATRPEVRLTLSIPADLPPHANVQLDFYEDGGLLLSEGTTPGTHFTLSALQLGHTYSIALSGSLRGEFTLALETVRFDLRDIVALVVYHLAGGNARQALALSEAELPGFSSVARPAGLVAELCRGFAALFTGPQLTLGPVPCRAKPLTAVVRQAEVGTVLGSILSSRVRGAWSARLAAAEPKPEEWEGIYREVSAAVAKAPGNEQLELLCEVLEVWLHQRPEGSLYDMALAALLARLERILATAERGRENDSSVCGR